MNTDTGRIYDPEQYERLEKAARADRAAIEVEYRQQFNAQEIADFQAGKVVPVSEHVASLMREGKASAERKAKRKAAQTARRKNRGRR